MSHAAEVESIRNIALLRDELITQRLVPLASEGAFFEKVDRLQKDNKELIQISKTSGLRDEEIISKGEGIARRCGELLREAATMSLSAPSSVAHTTSVMGPGSTEYAARQQLFDEKMVTVGNLYRSWKETHPSQVAPQCFLTYADLARKDGGTTLAQLTEAKATKNMEILNHYFNILEGAEREATRLVPQEGPSR